jgi:hypothetical protein
MTPTHDTGEDAKMKIRKLTILLFAALFILSLGVLVNAQPRHHRKAEPQPLMRAALVSLRAAKGQLEKATHDKGGHRVRAIGLIDKAIREVEKGIAFDDATPDRGKRHKRGHDDE